MPSDIRTAAQREAKRLRVTSNGRQYGMAKLYKDAFVDGAVWAQARVTPTREQIAEAIMGVCHDPYFDGLNFNELRPREARRFYESADAVLALMQELAEGESSG